MLTVKWCTESFGATRERVFETETVEVAWPDQNPADFPRKLGIYDVPDTGLVAIGNPHQGAESMAFAHGKIYVMNDKGKTVASYQLAPCTASAEAGGIPA